ncbi:MAG: hypothetical protein ACXVH3_37935, partial [Solirubrobacteraceae bacterium]
NLDRSRRRFLRCVQTQRTALRTSCAGLVPAPLVERDGPGQEQWFVLTLSDLDAIGVAHAQPLLRHGRDDLAVALDLVLIVNDVPRALRSSRPSMSISKRWRIPTSALWTVASFRPSRSTFIVSRARSFFSWMLATSQPSRSFRTKVSRTRSALPSTLVSAIALVILDPGIIADRRELLLHLDAAAARNIVAVSE